MKTKLLARYNSFVSGWLGVVHWRGNFDRDRFRTQQFDRLPGQSKNLHNISIEDNHPI
jgi:hypothetical protein